MGRQCFRKNLFSYFRENGEEHIQDTRETVVTPHCKQIFRDSWIIFSQDFQGLGLGTLFPARESLVSDFLAGDREIANPLFTVYALPLV